MRKMCRCTYYKAMVYQEDGLWIVGGQSREKSVNLRVGCLIYPKMPAEVAD